MKLTKSSFECHQALVVADHNNTFALLEWKYISSNDKDQFLLKISLCPFKKEFSQCYLFR